MNAQAGADRLAQECRNKAAEVMSLARTRLDHPSYGVTIAQVVAAWNELRGMLTGWAYATGTWGHSGGILWTLDTKAAIREGTQVDLDGLQARLFRLGYRHI